MCLRRTHRFRPTAVALAGLCSAAFFLNACGRSQGREAGGGVEARDVAKSLTAEPPREATPPAAQGGSALSTEVDDLSYRLLEGDRLGVAVTIKNPPPDLGAKIEGHEADVWKMSGDAGRQRILFIVPVRHEIAAMKKKPGEPYTMTLEVFNKKDPIADRFILAFDVIPQSLLAPPGRDATPPHADVRPRPPAQRREPRSSNPSGNVLSGDEGPRVIEGEEKRKAREKRAREEERKEMERRHKMDMKERKRLEMERRGAEEKLKVQKKREEAERKLRERRPNE